jgi:hypothetical protein
MAQLLDILTGAFLALLGAWAFAIAAAGLVFGFAFLV